MARLSKGNLARASVQTCPLQDGREAGDTAQTQCPCPCPCPAPLLPGGGRRGGGGKGTEQTSEGVGSLQLLPRPARHLPFGGNWDKSAPGANCL